METTPAPNRKIAQQKNAGLEKPKKDIEKMLVEKKLITPTSTSKFQKLLNTTFFKFFLSIILFSLLFSIAFVISYFSHPKDSVQTLPNLDIIPSAEIKIPTSATVIPSKEEETKSPADIQKVSPTPIKSTSNSNCVVAGCNDELCVEDNQKDKIASICVYNDEYSCYRNAKCEKQKDGKCGWSQSTELKTCLSQYQ